ncbi:SAM-dependent methyltransferase [Nocardia sp. NPDC051570]|uniref:SAM-dependent methyltransferase n=1 Tax=Nocardia sp. NPDC051570 TaxID=3364324 RepID=UPI00379C13DC
MAVRASDTAVGPMAVAAIERNLPREQRLFTDDLAIRMLPPPVRWTVAATRWAPARRAVLAALGRAMDPRVLLWMVCRKRYLDDMVTAAVAEGFEMVVVLGAGFDTRGYRLGGGVPVLEVDQPVNIAAKRARMAVPDHVTLVPIDFETDDLATVLTQYGYRTDLRTVFVWEGVTQYLTESAVRATLSALADAAPGSRLGFTYVLSDFLDGTALDGMDGFHRRFVGEGKIWLFGLAPEAVAPLLAEYGWREREQLDADACRTRYLDPAHRPGRVTRIERCVLAEKS